MHFSAVRLTESSTPVEQSALDGSGPELVASAEDRGFSCTSSARKAGVTAAHRAVGIPDERGIRVALISRLELHDRTDIQPFPTGLLPIQVGDDPPGPDRPKLMNQMGRGALRARVTVGNRDAHLVTTHLKSKLLTFPGGFAPTDEDQRARFAAYALYRRASEATTLRSSLDTLLNGGGQQMAVILTCDMNDEVDAATTQILNGPPGSEIGTGGFSDPDRGDGDRGQVTPTPARLQRRCRRRSMSDWPPATEPRAALRATRAP